MQRKNTFLGHFFFTKKNDFRAFFGHGQRSVAEPGPTPSPRSIVKKLHCIAYLSNEIFKTETTLLIVMGPESSQLLYFSLIYILLGCTLFPFGGGALMMRT